jgi:hypothetical protein
MLALEAVVGATEDSLHNMEAAAERVVIRVMGALEELLALLGQVVEEVALMTLLLIPQLVMVAE